MCVERSLSPKVQISTNFHLLKQFFGKQQQEEKNYLIHRLQFASIEVNCQFPKLPATRGVFSVFWVPYNKM